MQSPATRIAYKDLTRELELDLLRRFQAGDRAAGDTLLHAHEPIIWDVVRHYFNKGLAMEDVMQAGRYGFFRAMQRFDLDSGNRLTTYATKYARGYAQKALMDEGSTIRVGRTVTNQLRECRRAKKQVPERIEGYILLRRSVSLSKPVGRHGEESGELGDVIPCDAPGPDETVADDDAQRRRADIVMRALTHLTTREQEIVRRRFAEDPETFEAIGAAMGFTKQRTEQIMKRAMPKLSRAARRITQPGDEVLWGGKRVRPAAVSP